MVPHMESLTRQLKAYREGWAAVAGGECTSWELRLQLRLALDLWSLVQAAIERRTFQLRVDHSTTRDELLRDQHALYAAWFDPSAALVERLRAEGRAGEFYERFGELEYVCAEVAAYLKYNVEDTIRGLQDVDAGRRIPLSELRDELRNRRRAIV